MAIISLQALKFVSPVITLVKGVKVLQLPAHNVIVMPIESQCLNLATVLVLIISMIRGVMKSVLLALQIVSPVTAAMKDSALPVIMEHFSCRELAMMIAQIITTMILQLGAVGLALRIVFSV